MGKYILMILMTEGEHKGYYNKLILNDICELAYLYEKEPGVIERCCYIYDVDRNEYLSILDKDRIIGRYRIMKRYLERYDPFGESIF